MRELSVYYCPHCGHYAYYQLARHAVCPKCDIPMQVLDMRFQDFMNLTREERDDLLSFEILSTSCPTGLSMSKRLAASQNIPNNREIIAALTQKIQALEDENIPSVLTVVLPLALCSAIANGSMGRRNCSEAISCPAGIKGSGSVVVLSLIHIS